MSARATNRLGRPAAQGRDGRMLDRIQQVEAAPEPWRAQVIKGGVTSGGSVDKGAGFTVSRTGTGRYTVTFDTAFPTNPVVVATMDGVGTTTYTDVLYVSVVSTTQFSVACNWPGDGTARDRAFNFIAMRQ